MKTLAGMFPVLLVGVAVSGAAACSSDPAGVVSPETGDGGGGDGGGGGKGDGGGSSSGGSCSAATEQLLKPIDTVSTGEVTIVSNSDGVKTLYVDASAGGSTGAATSPRLYLNLETGTRVAVTDKTAAKSTAWDLAIKRPILFTNSGSGGSGQGGAALVVPEFEAVTPADASGATLATESFLSSDCTAKLDATGAVQTTFDGWYDYETATNVLTPHAGTWIVKGGTGKLFKVQITSYYAAPGGGTGQAGGRYSLKVAAL